MSTSIQERAWNIVEKRAAVRRAKKPTLTDAQSVNDVLTGDDADPIATDAAQLYRDTAGVTPADTSDDDDDETDDDDNEDDDPDTVPTVDPGAAA